MQGIDCVPASDDENASEKEGYRSAKRRRDE